MIVVTRVEPTGGAPLGAAPILAELGHECVVYSLKAASIIVGIAEKTIRNDLAEFPGQFDCRQYFPVTVGSRWKRRVLTVKDVAWFRTRYGTEKTLSSHK